MDRQKHRRDVSAREVLHGAGGARVRNVCQVDLRRQLQQLHGEMLRRASTGGSIVDFARLAARKCDQLRERGDVERRMNDQRKNSRRDLRDRREALFRIVGDRAIKARIHHKRIDGHQKRLAIRSRARRGLRADVATRTRLVLDDDRLIPALPQFLTEDAREQIGPCAWRERNVEPDCLLRLPLSQAWHHWGKGHGQNPQHRAARMRAACGSLMICHDCLQCFAILGDLHRGTIPSPPRTVRWITNKIS